MFCHRGDFSLVKEAHAELARLGSFTEVATQTIEEYDEMIKKSNSKQDKSNIIDDHCYMLDRKTGRFSYPKWAREIW